MRNVIVVFSSLIFFLQKDMNALHFAAQHGFVNITTLMLEAETHTDVVDSVSTMSNFECLLFVAFTGCCIAGEYILC